MYGTDGVRLAVVLRVRLRVALLEEEELELGAEHRLEARARAPARPAPRAPAAATAPTGEPSCQSTSQSTSAVASSHGIRRSVARSGCEPEVAVPALPARHRVAGHRVHLHLEREQVVAALDAVLDRLVEEEVRVQALAHQPALHVGEGDDDGVDRAALHLRAQFVKRSARLILSQIRSLDSDLRGR